MRYAIGSHLVADRTCYTHHGIYVEGDCVIHYLDGRGVARTSFGDFSCGRPVRVRLHPGSPHSGSECARRAASRLGERSYSLLFNNCEHFANWCAEGESRSGQVRRAECVCAAAVVGEVVAAQAVRKVVVGTAIRAVATAAAGLTGSAAVGAAVAAVAPAVAAGTAVYALGEIFDWWD